MYPNKQINQIIKTNKFIIIYTTWKIPKNILWKVLKLCTKKIKKCITLKKKLLTRYIIKIISHFNKKYYEHKKYKLQYPYFPLKHAINIWKYSFTQLYYALMIKLWKNTKYKLLYLECLQYMQNYVFNFFLNLKRNLSMWNLQCWLNYNHNIYGIIIKT